MTTSEARTANSLSLAWRALLPLVILAAAGWGFVQLSSEVEPEPPPEKEVRTLRTRIDTLDVVDYPVRIETNAVVQAHNRVTLSAEVSGAVVRVSESFEVGAYFDKGEVLVEIDPQRYATALAIAESRLQGARSALDLAQLDEQRKLRLVERNAVSQAEVDEASATREQAEAQVELAKSEMEQAKLDLERTKIVAPFDGRVQTKTIGLGQMANANTPLGEIFAVDFAEVRLPISASQRPFVTLPEFAGDLPVTVELRDALAASNDTVWSAKIVRTEGLLDLDSRDVFAIARIDDPFGRTTGKPPLRIGQPVVASIEGKVLEDVIALPRAAVRQLDKVILVNQQDQTLLPLRVEAIWSNAEHVIVEGASIPQGMWLATTPMVYAPEGAVVEILPDHPTTSIADSSPDQPDSATN